MHPVYMDFTENHDLYFIQKLVTKGDVKGAEAVDFDKDIFQLDQDDEESDSDDDESDSDDDESDSDDDDDESESDDDESESDDDDDDDESESESDKNRSVFARLKDGEEFEISELPNGNKPALKMDDDFIYRDLLYTNLHCTLKAKMSEVITKLVDPKYTYSFDFGLYKSGEPSEVLETTNQYVITYDNQLRINKRQRKQLSRYLNQNFKKIQKTIIRKLNGIKFALPQKRGNYENFFCNENVYGNFNFLVVYGFLNYE
jgi:cobalamin biosynthesis protein CobT